MVYLLLKPWSTQTHTEGRQKHLHLKSTTIVCFLWVCLMILLPQMIYNRIVQVDLKFPPKPIVSASAKDLISQVFLYLQSNTYTLRKVVVVESKILTYFLD